MTLPLPGQVDQLLREQREEWPLLRKGQDGLAAARTRALTAGGAGVLVRHIPHRAASTTAAVDGASIAKRPCFLCAENLDPRERGVTFLEDFTIYPNPFPIVPRHLTIVHREHRPQRVAGLAGPMLDLAAALPGLFVIYNGPRCGASAPDHLHLQAGSRDGLPIVDLAARATGPLVEGYGVTAIALRGIDRARLAGEMDRVLAALAAATKEPTASPGGAEGGAPPPMAAAVAGQEPEPWVNVAVFHEAERGFTVLVFPRGKHRPDAFHSGELTVSPAAIDLCGILVAPVERDFERLTGADVAAIFREVTLPEERLRAAVALL